MNNVGSANKLDILLEAMLVAYDDSSAGVDEVQKQAKKEILDLFLEMVPEDHDSNYSAYSKEESGWLDCRKEILLKIQELR